MILHHDLHDAESFVKQKVWDLDTDCCIEWKSDHSRRTGG